MNQDNKKESLEAEESSNSSSILGLLKHLPLPKSGYMMIGFLLIAAVSGWMNLKQAQTIDAFGDVLSAQAEIEDEQNQVDLLLKEKRHPETKDERKDKINERVKEHNKKISNTKDQLTEERLHVTANGAAMLNGTWFWTLFIQIGSAAFGIGIINVLMDKKEDNRIRSAAMFVIGFVAIFLLFSRLISMSVINDLMKLAS